MNEPIKIDLLEFFRTGKFDYLKLGQTKQWIKNNFPDPDGNHKDSYNSPIWCFGNIELHFDTDDTLFLIFSDYIDTLNGGDSLSLNKWILNEPDRLTLEYVIQQLNIERISFKLVHRKLSEGMISTLIEILDSKVSLRFEPVENDKVEFEEYLLRCRTEDANKFMLGSFSLMR